MYYLHSLFRDLLSLFIPRSFFQLTIFSSESSSLNTGNSVTVAFAIDVFATIFGYRLPDLSTNKSTIKLKRLRRFLVDMFLLRLQLSKSSSAPLFFK